MLFIFGTKTLGTTLKEGNFYCARCAQDRTYQLKSNRRFFSIFFIPLIPLNKVADTVECTYCKTAYIPNASIIENYVSSTAEVDHLAKPLASYGKRFGGYVIDIILLTILIFPLSFVAVRFQKYLPQNFIIVFTTMWVIYFFLMEWLLGATVGKKFLGIRSVSE